VIVSVCSFGMLFLGHPLANFIVFVLAFIINRVFYMRRQLLLSACLSHCSSVRPSVTQVDQSKTVQARITKSSPLAAWKTLVSGTVQLFRKFKGGHPEQG